jgi:hypothetical protein
LAKLVEEDDMGGACGPNGGEDKHVYVIGGKARGKETTRRPRHRWVDNIKMDVGERGWGAVHWIDLAQDKDRWRALVNVVMNLLVP